MGIQLDPNVLGQIQRTFPSFAPMSGFAPTSTLDTPAGSDLAQSSAPELPPSEVPTPEVSIPRPAPRHLLPSPHDAELQADAVLEGDAPVDGDARPDTETGLDSASRDAGTENGATETAETEIAGVGPAHPSSARAGFLRRPFFQLQRVVFFGLASSEPDTVIASLSLSEAQPLIDVAPREVCRRVLELGRFSHCTAFRLPPHTLAVAVRERTPIGIVEATGQAVAADGTRFDVVSERERARLPLIAGDVMRALAYVDAARWAAIPLERIEVGDDAERPRVTAALADSDLQLLLGSDPIRDFLRYRALSGAPVLKETGLELDLRFRGNAFLRKTAASPNEDEGKEA